LTRVKQRDGGRVGNGGGDELEEEARKSSQGMTKGRPLTKESKRESKVTIGEISGGKKDARPKKKTGRTNGTEPPTI